LQEKIVVRCLLPTNFKALFEHEKWKPFEEIFGTGSTNETGTRLGGKSRGTYGTGIRRDTMQESTSYKDTESESYT
jgi:hypothetical protein